MNAKQIYELNVLRENKELYEIMGFYYNHIPEVDFYGVDLSLNTKVVVKEHGYHNFDGRRFWRLASVWYNDKPVMIIQNAGREGDDHAKRFVTDGKLYSDMVYYLFSLEKKPDVKVNDIIADDIDIPELTCFYGHSLDEC